jgi:tape measure domain-containing protein
MAQNLGKLNIVIGANDKTKGAFNSIQRNVQGVNNQLSTLRNVFIAAFSVRELTRAADEFTNLNNKLLALTGSTDSAAEGLEHVKRIAKESRSDLDAVGDLFGKIAFSTSEMGISLDDVADATQTVMNTFVMAGASAIEASNASRQLAQGLASGTLRGDELNSVMEQNTILAQLLADGLGISKGALRDFGAEGLITAEKILPILIREVGNTSEEIKKMQLTIGQSVTLLRNSFTEFIGEGSKVVPLNNAIAKSIKTIADNLALFLIPTMTLLAATTLPLLIGAFRGLFTILRANPFTLLATTIVTAASALFAFKEELLKSLGLMARPELEQINNRIESIQRSLSDNLAAMMDSRGHFIELTEEEIAALQKELDLLLQRKAAIEGTTFDVDSARETNKFLEAVSGAMNTYKDKVGDTNMIVQKSFERTFINLENVFAKFFETGKIGIKDFSRIMISELSKIVAQALILQILTGGKAAGAGGISGFIKNLISDKNAIGGPVTGGRVSLVGEKGPELFVPNRSGYIIPNDRLGMSGNGVPVNITYNIQSFDSRDTLQAITENAPAISGIIEQQFNRRGKRGFTAS